MVLRDSRDLITNSAQLRHVAAVVLVSLFHFLWFIHIGNGNKASAVVIPATRRDGMVEVQPYCPGNRLSHTERPARKAVELPTPFKIWGTKHPRVCSEEGRRAFHHTFRGVSFFLPEGSSHARTFCPSLRLCVPQRRIWESRRSTCKNRFSGRWNHSHFGRLDRTSCCPPQKMSPCSTEGKVLPSLDLRLGLRLNYFVWTPNFLRHEFRRVLCPQTALSGTVSIFQGAGPHVQPVRTWRACVATSALLSTCPVHLRLLIVLQKLELSV